MEDYSNLFYEDDIEDLDFISLMIFVMILIVSVAVIKMTVNMLCFDFWEVLYKWVLLKVLLVQFLFSFF